MSGGEWAQIEAAAVQQLITEVRRVRQEFPQERIYGAIFHEFYGDGSVIYWPQLTIGTEEGLRQVHEQYAGDYDVADLRWSGPDLSHTSDPGPTETSLAARCHAKAAAKGGFDAWNRDYERFLRCFPKAAKRGRTELVREKVVGRDFIAIAADEAGELIPLSLTRAQLRKHFPEYDQAEQERRRISALPLADQVDELVPFAVGADPGNPGVLIGEYDELVRALGEVAVPSLLDVVTKQAPGSQTSAIILLAEINQETPAGVAALCGVMLDSTADLNARAWAAAALARLDRAELILEHVQELPEEVVGRGLTGPYRSFRDRGRHRMLDYRPLEAAVRAHPELEPLLTEELEPGVGFCQLTEAEVPIAQAALNSPYEFIRVHASIALENRAAWSS